MTSFSPLTLAGVIANHSLALADQLCWREG